MMDFIVFRKNKISFLYERKSLITFIILLILAVASVLLSLSIGKTNFSIIEVIKTLLGMGSKYDELMIKHFRLPRALAGLLVGTSLALSGTILQGIAKNPLASPNLIGVVDGGSVGALIFLTIFLSPRDNSLTVSIFFMPIFALITAFLVAFLVYVTAFKNGVNSLRLILVGIAFSGIAKALTTLLIINGPLIFIAEANTWITGTVYGTNWAQVKLLALWFLIFLVITLLYIRDLNVQNLDDHLAIGLGTKLERKRLIMILLSAALASGAVAVGGGISFVGLIAPHIARQLTNSSFENVIPLSILIGGIMVVLADIIARTMFYPLDLPVGIFTASIGAPFFIFLLWKKQK
ncbi:iron chelate uptake ABC transporter family permease subunit [Clostridium bovifaecis]|uniref:Iron chelate uptake ABC transporter family permease subunit n=1 Tax=Clostridium bovifaecis TaxID=2184719 RepID=A0A6I6F0V0_9CLOT|nr:iron chelate uptake ABC transporter family permease subunit [Clostridium bovifaecis]